MSEWAPVCIAIQNVSDLVDDDHTERRGTSSSS
jgi:hypothetical protein